MTEIEDKKAIIKMLAEQMVQYKFNEFKDYDVPEDWGLPELKATINILTKQVANAKLGQAKLVKFDKLETERANLTPEELVQLQADQERNNDRIDSYLATLEPRASLRGNIQAPNTIILRYRGKGINSEFSKTYPFGVLI